MSRLLTAAAIPAALEPAAFADHPCTPHELLDPSRCCALYLRRSHKFAEGDPRNGRSLAEQEKDERDLAARLGLFVVWVYTEKEGTSASRFSNKDRPEWLRALADLRVGDKFHTLLVWALDRADRRGAVEIGKILDEHVDGSRRVVGVDGTDTGDSRRRLEMIIRAEIAREEVENLSRRVSRTKRRQRDEGLWLSGRTPYGTRKNAEGKLEPDPEFYPIARRRIAEPLLAGTTIWETVQTLNAEGIPSPSGGTWQVGTVSQLVRSPGFAGLQGLRGKTAAGNWNAVADVYRNAKGKTVSVGKGVITLGERARILRLIGERSERLARNGLFVQRGNRRSRAMLGDLLRCPYCDFRTQLSGARDKKHYRCNHNANGHPCPGFTAPVAEIESAVSLAFLSRLATLEPGEPLLEAVADAWVARVSPDDLDAREAAQDALDAARDELARVRRLVVSGVFTEQDAAEVMPELRRSVEEAEQSLAAIPLPDADISPLLDLAQSVPAFEALPTPERAGLLALAIERVTCTRAGTRGVRFEPDQRVTIHWKDGTTSRPAPGPVKGKRVLIAQAYAANPAATPKEIAHAVGCSLWSVYDFLKRREA
ncbi:hypothetical protein Acy02nite_68240 [Actinoplanes cyaneus]|uniref:Resolvase/invertase-type recombinase catalytic domain-containing protein n=1 Tax=Actinoplanes cyaneus TaxID=52696 RepID=A0A919IP73_9ACTN|nr:recombinase family protein [Actinoplanes cyaneus]MCW2139123.1 Site-specific DNA recombinase [Actinoplanes cyaneus]GID68943.1 hypothetical protein Acy02nite_68240 [Actinoplanes cyaneus]